VELRRQHERQKARAKAQACNQTERDPQSATSARKPRRYGFQRRSARNAKRAADYQAAVIAHRASFLALRSVLEKK
jgi:hypothetical protein